MFTGRKRDAIWKYFTEVKTDSKTLKVKCVNCQTQMSALVARMKTHFNKNCPGAGSSNNGDVDTPSFSSLKLT
ncbi:BED-type domain-containing protein [Aphis craccivora]|uniref:BED-type domain-containing protein n=1 Tax=Aphis craccivora TaxID=307492 RepID=A0A6G0Y027_APHCR|nr:BED-type domain-containing protein [Aphis craccivora]